MTERIVTQWADLPGALRTLIKVGALIGGVLFGLFGGVAWTARADDLGPRVSALEVRMTSMETFGRYTACVLQSQSRGMDPTPCESHLSPSALDYLRPAGP